MVHSISHWGCVKRIFTFLFPTFLSPFPCRKWKFTHSGSYVGLRGSNYILFWETLLYRSYVKSVAIRNDCEQMRRELTLLIFDPVRFTEGIIQMSEWIFPARKKMNDGQKITSLICVIMYKEYYTDCHTNTECVWSPS